MGCIQTGRKTIITANPLLRQDKNESLIITQSSPQNNHKKRSTLKEISRLALNSKDIKIKSLINLIDTKPEDNYRIKKRLGKGSFGNVYKVEHKVTGEIRAMKIIKNPLSANVNP